MGAVQGSYGQGVLAMSQLWWGVLETNLRKGFLSREKGFYNTPEKKQRVGEWKCGEWGELLFPNPTILNLRNTTSFPKSTKGESHTSMRLAATRGTGVRGK